MPSASVRSVTPDYFRTLGIPLRRGAVFEAQRDTASARAVVVNEALAREAFGGEDPVGRQILSLGKAPWTVVGVVADVAIGKLEDEVPPTIYHPFARLPEGSMRLAVRTRGDVAGLETAVRRIVRDLDPQVALYQVYTMESLLRQSESVFLRRFPLLLVGAFAATALALAVVGTYGVISYSVAQRVRELGIRIALGARSAHVVSLVVRQAALLAAVGIGAGLVAAAVLSRYASSLLFGVRAGDPSSYAAAALLLGAVAAAAAAVPAWRATRVDPVRALRGE
jgi:predicted permease